MSLDNHTKRQERNTLELKHILGEQLDLHKQSQFLQFHTQVKKFSPQGK